MTSLSDGNGAYRVARQPVSGATRVATFLAAGIDRVLGMVSPDKTAAVP